MNTGTEYKIYAWAWIRHGRHTNWNRYSWTFSSGFVRWSGFVRRYLLRSWSIRIILLALEFSCLFRPGIHRPCFPGEFTSMTSLDTWLGVWTGNRLSKVLSYPLINTLTTFNLKGTAYWIATIDSSSNMSHIICESYIIPIALQLYCIIQFVYLEDLSCRCFESFSGIPTYSQTQFEFKGSTP